VRSLGRLCGIGVLVGTLVGNWSGLGWGREWDMFIGIGNWNDRLERWEVQPRPFIGE
jgi:hypothetical protein